MKYEKAAVWWIMFIAGMVGWGMVMWGLVRWIEL